MKNVNSFVSTLLILQMGSSFADVIPFEVRSENKLITELRNETDLSKKDALESSLINKCPFKEDQPELNDLVLLSTNLSATSGIKDAKKAECQTYVDDINKSLTNTRRMQAILSNPNSGVSANSTERLSQDLSSTLAGTSSLHSLLTAQCSVDQNSVVSRTNQIIGAVESGSAAVAFVNPIAALVGAGAAATGRLAVGLGGWLKNRNKKDSGESVKDSVRFINDLCSFRNVTYKYDKVSNDALNKAAEEAVVKIKDPQIEKDLINRKNTLEAELANNKDLITCSQIVKVNVDSLQAFSVELAPFLDKQSSQKECLNILNKYLDSKSDAKLGAVDNLAKRYNCSGVEEIPTDKKNIPFCKNYQAIEKMAKGDLYESCEDENFQKNISAKFTNLTVLIMRSVQEDMKEAAPAVESINKLQVALQSVDDELQRLRDSEQNEKLAGEKVDSLSSVMDMNSVTNMNILKEITSAGRNILGERFDVFANKSMKSAAVEIKEASRVLNELIKQNSKLDKNKLFSKKYTEVEKRAVRAEICSSALQVKRQFINGHRTYSVVKDVCDFNKGNGIPSLKSPGINYDNYSASSSNRANNLTNRCKAIDESVARNNTVVKEQMSIMSGLGCEI